ncbi:MAG TPA: hypothetical protein VJC16_06865 [Candidatus Nanoarchaeia archaeon]|nr:hypothetical protein [Candidatus Nanoarchaeia archaeon]
MKRYACSLLLLLACSAASAQNVVMDAGIFAQHVAECRAVLGEYDDSLRAAINRGNAEQKKDVAALCHLQSGRAALLVHLEYLDVLNSFQGAFAGRDANASSQEMLSVLVLFLDRLEQYVESARVLLQAMKEGATSP